MTNTNATNAKPQGAERDPLDLIAEALNAITDNAKYWKPIMTAQHAQSVIVEHVRDARNERDALRERVRALTEEIERYQPHYGARDAGLSERELVLREALAAIAAVLESPRDRLGRLDIAATQGEAREALRLLAVKYNATGGTDYMHQCANVARAALRGQS